MDVMNLYPYVCKYFKFPLGHPVIHVGDGCQYKEAMLQKGLIKCSILPPQILYHPELPFRCNGKLQFCLCMSWANERNLDGECCHETVNQRALTGRWVAEEMRLNVHNGYEVIEVFEVYEYYVTQYDPQTG